MTNDWFQQLINIFNCPKCGKKLAGTLLIKKSKGRARLMGQCPTCILSYQLIALKYGKTKRWLVFDWRTQIWTEIKVPEVKEKVVFI